MKTKLSLLLTLTLFLISFISASNLYNATTPLFNGSNIVSLNVSNGADWNNLTCDQKLNDTVAWYNSCVDIIQNGTNCGIVYNTLNNYNDQCKTNLTSANQKLENYNTYKYGFFICLGLLFIMAIIWIIIGRKSNSEKLNQTGETNGRKR